MPALADPAPTLRYAALLLRSQRLIDQGLGDSAQAEELADEMDQPWAEMTAQEQRRMRGLSSDLYALDAGGPKDTLTSPEEVAAWRQRGRSAHDRSATGDVDGYLDFLRRPFPADVPRDAVLFLQARCWEKLGDLGTALVFLRAAEAASPRYSPSVLHLLLQQGDRDAIEAQVERVVGSPDATATGLFLAGFGMLRLARRSGAELPLRRMRDVLRRAEDERRRRPDEQVPPRLDVGIALILGLCLEKLGDADGATAAYTRALAAHPEDSELLTARGIAQFARDAQAAIQDFVRATRAGASRVWPWHFLARHALLSGAYGEALRLAIRASQLPGHHSARAEVYETIALAQAKLGQSAALVLENLETAARLDPDNERLGESLAELRRSSGAREWVARSKILRPAPRTPEARAEEQYDSWADIFWERRETQLSLEHLVV